MDTLANILSGIPANPLQGGGQGISPQLMQMLLAQQMGKQQLSPDMPNNMPNGGPPGIGASMMPNASPMAGQLLPGLSGNPIMPQLMQTPAAQTMPGSMGNIALGLAAGKY
jgi:hypothetical protein